MPSVFPSKLIIGCMVMFFTSFGIEIYLHTKTSEYRGCESTSSISVLQERILMIDHIEVISWDIQLLQEFISTEIQTSFCYPKIPSCLV